MSIQKIIFSCIIVFTFYFCGKNRKVQQKIEQTQNLAIDKKYSMKFLSEIMFFVFRKLHFIRFKETVEETKENKVIRYEYTNFTIIIFAFTLLGPTHE